MLKSESFLLCKHTLAPEATPLLQPQGKTPCSHIHVETPGGEGFKDSSVQVTITQPAEPPLHQGRFKVDIGKDFSTVQHWNRLPRAVEGFKGCGNWGHGLVGLRGVFPNINNTLLVLHNIKINLGDVLPLILPVMKRNPSLSCLPRSPECSQPSSSMASLVLSSMFR